MDKAEIIKIAVEASKEYDQKQRVKNIKSRHDKRLRNTRLLLKHYNYFHCHADESIYKSSQLNAIDVLDEIDDCRSDVYIQSIKKSAIKTNIILSHINAMVELYRAYCDRVGASEQRKFRVLKSFYFDQAIRLDIMRKEHISESTFFRDIDDAINTLSALIFGIDAVHEMTE
jgi:hypothetical protein